MILRVSSPCPKSWMQLRGNDRVRYCNECRLHVYNVADMSGAEIRDLVRRSSGRFCGRLYLRGDRTATLRDCPRQRQREFLRRTFLAASFLALVVFAALFRGMARPDTSSLPGWVRAVADVIDPPRPDWSHCEVVGIVMPPKSPVPPPPPVPATGN